MVSKRERRAAVSDYREASSDDEFTRQHLIYPSSDSDIEGKHPQRVWAALASHVLPPC